MVLKVLSFRFANKLFGVEITKVREINRNVEYTAVPRAPENIIGLFNMRGQIVTLFNLPIMLGFDYKINNEKVTCIILKAEMGSPNQRGFVIERTGDVIDVDENICEQPPANIDDKGNLYIKAVVRLKNELMRIVDTDILFDN